MYRAGFATRRILTDHFCRQKLPLLLAHQHLRTTSCRSFSARKAKFLHPRVQQSLVNDSIIFLSRNDELRAVRSHQEVIQLLTQWQNDLFSIPFKDNQRLAQAATTIHDLLEFLLNIEKDGNQGSSKTLDLVCTGILAWGRLAPYDSGAPAMAEQLADEISKLHGGDKKGLHKVFSAMAYCWSQEQTDAKAPTRALFWMNSIRSLGLEIELATLNAVLRSYARRGEIDEVLRILDSVQMEDQDPYVYESLIQAYLESRHPDGPRLAFQILQQGIECFHRSNSSASLAQMMARYMNMSRENPESVEMALRHAMAVEAKSPSRRFLQRRHFLIALTAWASKGSYSRALALFQQMETFYETGDDRFEPTYSVLCVLLSSMTKTKDIHMLGQAERLLDYMESALDVSDGDWTSNHAYNIILDAYATTAGVEDRLQKLEGIVEKMKELSQTKQEEKLMPDKISYTALLRGIVLEAPPDSEARIDDIINLMENSGDGSLQPDAKFYTMIFESLNKNFGPESLKQAMALRDRIQKRHLYGFSQVRMDAYMYTILMKICSRARNVRRSDIILATMVEDFERGVVECRPTETAFLTAMGTWTRSGRPDAYDGALRLYHLMLVQYRHGNQACLPTRKTFSELMLALAKSHCDAPLRIADRLILEMEKFDIKPGRLNVNLYLRICSAQQSTEELGKVAFSRAVETFDYLHENAEIGADSNSYLSMVYVALNHIRNEKECVSFLTKLYTRARSDANLDEKLFLSSLQRVIGSEIYDKVLVASGKTL